MSACAPSSTPRTSAITIQEPSANSIAKRCWRNSIESDGHWSYGRALLLRQRRDKFHNRASRHGMSPIRRDVGQRNQNESAIRHARMRQNRRPGLHPAVVIDQIEIERARSILLATRASIRYFNRMQNVQQRGRRTICTNFNDGVYVRRIRWVGPSRSRIEVRYSLDFHAFTNQRLHRIHECLRGRSRGGIKVGAE